MKSIAAARLRLPEKHWPFLTRAAWVILCFTTGVILLSAAWGTYAYYSNPQGCANGSAQAQAECLADARLLHQFGLPAEYFGIQGGLGVIVEALPMILVGILIYSRKSRDPFAWVFSLSVMVSGTVSFDGGIPYSYEQVWSKYPVLVAIGNFMVLLGGALMVVWYCFPDGRWAPRWTRWLAVAWVGKQAASFFFPGSPLDITAWPDVVSTVTNYLFAVSVVYSLIYRYRRLSDAVQRQQIKWIVAIVAVYVLILVVDPRPFVANGQYMGLRDLFYTPFSYLSGAVLATGIAFSILRYRLWDIDFLINRALVYGTLSALVICIYVLVVGGLGALMESNANWLVAIVATGLIALLVQPLRDRLQHSVNRMMYGERDDPITVLSRLGQQLETTLAPDALLPCLVQTVAETLKLPYVAIELENGNCFEAQRTADLAPGGVAPSHKQPDVVSFPLVYQAETIGQLGVATRAAGEAFSPMDRHLLENIARQAGIAAHAVSITNELQEARQRLVTATEEERRRLRRDLHDGLGPALASQGLKLAAAKQLLQGDPESAASLLDQVMTQNQETVSDVRRLVYGLRPPVLDERGLVEAIQDHIWQDGAEARGLRLDVGQLPAELHSLPAAVEVAAYRIALEALTNIIHHAQATHGSVRFAANGAERNSSLQIEIVDNGIGLPAEHHAGVGLRSMRERAEELGGSLTVEPVPHGGTRVVAVLPLGSHLRSMDFDASTRSGHR
jgi:signal transduction histidine kinase